MNYTIEKFNLGKYKFDFAQWSHPFCTPKTFSLEQIETQTKYLSKGDIVIDIGAFSGDTPILYANAVGKEGKVLSFEANPHAYEILEANSKLNKHLNVIPIPKAVTEKPGTYTFHYSDHGFCNGGFAEEIDTGIGATGHVVPLEVEGVNLTDWLEENLDKKEWDKISFIKIDTEGYDYKILRSNKDLFTKIRPILEVELYPALSLREVKEFYKVLKEIGYEVFQQHKETDCSLDSLTTSLDEWGFIGTFKSIKSGENIIAYPKEKTPKDKLKQPIKNITLVIPTYNNLQHIKNAYTSVRKFYPELELVLLDDGSTDDTKTWLDSLEDEFVIKYRSEERVGHTILYDKGIDMATNEIVGIMHADMILGPNYIENVLKHLEKGKVICATRIEPPLHPEGKEKIVRNFGMDFDDLNIEAFEAFVLEAQNEYKDQTTKGMFAPWIIYKDDFQSIGGHDPGFAPFPYEDSDIFQRWILAGYELVQSRDAFVYHLTCRGHRWTEQVGVNDNYFEIAEKKAREYYIRKWGSWISHDAFQYPIITPVYDKCLIINNTNPQLEETLECWFNNGTDVEVEVDGNTFTQQDFQIIQQLNAIIKDSGQVGEFKIGNIFVRINKLQERQNELINI